jgi:hypothetical protein
MMFRLQGWSPNGEDQRSSHDQRAGGTVRSVAKLGGCLEHSLSGSVWDRYVLPIVEHERHRSVGQIQVPGKVP